MAVKRSTLPGLLQTKSHRGAGAEVFTGGANARYGLNGLARTRRIKRRVGRCRCRTATACLINSKGLARSPTNCSLQRKRRDRVMVTPLESCPAKHGGLGGWVMTGRTSMLGAELSSIVPSNFRPSGDLTMAYGVGCGDGPGRRASGTIGRSGP